MDSHPLQPQVVGSSNVDGANPGVAWKLQVPQRDLDSNVIKLASGGRIASHMGPELDVLHHIIAGSGVITTTTGEVTVTPGDLVWLPRLTERAITAGADGLTYLTVHQRRTGLSLQAK